MIRIPHIAAALVAAGLVCTLRAAPQDQAREVANRVEAAGKENKNAQGAVAQVHGFGADKDKVKGTVTFTAVDGGVHVVAHVTGLTPGKHGFHLHENPIANDDPKSAGGHWNPGGHKHGGPESADHHAGDLGNLTADDKGEAKLDETIKGISVAGENALIGKSVIIHAKEDDLKGQPAGNSGDRIAGGNVESAKAQ